MPSPLPWTDGNNYQEKHGHIKGTIWASWVSPAPGAKCPMGRSFCDTDRLCCRYFGGVTNTGDLQRGRTDVADVLCRHRDTGASEDMHEWATAQDDRGYGGSHAR